MKMDDFFENLNDESMCQTVYRMVVKWADEHKDPNDMMVVAVRLEEQDRTRAVRLANYIRSKGFYCKQMGNHSQETDGQKEYVYSIGVKKTKFE